MIVDMHWPDIHVGPGYWIGQAGGLQPLPDLKGELNTEGYPRDWSVTIPQASPAEVAALYAMAAHDVRFSTDLSGARRARVSPVSPADVGPFHWITPYSRVTNLLPPRSVSGPEGWVGSSRSQGGPVALVDGMAASSVQVGAGGVSYSPLVPVVPGQHVTGSVYPRGSSSASGSFSLEWMDLGAQQNAPAKGVAGTRSVVSTAAPLQRLSVSAVVPANVHLARLAVRSVTQFAMPALTWTAQVQDRSAGQGCSSAIIHNLSTKPRLFREGTVREDVSFTVSEVG